jgi:hypothetical protein
LPVKIDARDGQHNGLTTNAFVKSTPCPISTRRVYGIDRNWSQR